MFWSPGTFWVFFCVPELDAFQRRLFPTLFWSQFSFMFVLRISKLTEIRFNTNRLKSTNICVMPPRKSKNRVMKCTFSGKVRIAQLLNLYYLRRRSVKLAYIENVCRRHFRQSVVGEIKRRRKRRKCWLPAFSPCPAMFSKTLLFL